MFLQRIGSWQPLGLLLLLLLVYTDSWGQNVTPEKRIKEAEAQIQKANLVEAEKLLQSIDPPVAKSLQLLGQIQVKRKRYEDALKIYDRYLQVETVASKKAAAQQLISDIKLLMKTRFKVVTNPPGATVFIDSKVDGPVGTTPLSAFVSPGRHKVMLELAGYEPIKLDISAIEQQELELPFTLTPSGCLLTVTTEPAGMPIVLDGKEMGKAPVSRRLRSGVYRVESILAQGDPPATAQVQCDEKEGKPLEVRLSRDNLPKDAQ